MLPSFIGKFFVLYFVCIIVGLIFNALIAVAINVDAKARDLKSATLYSVLAFFFPLIVGIVYGVTRNNAQKNDHPKLCQSCNITVDANAYACPKCGNTNLAVWANPNADSQMKKSVKIFIIAVVIYVISAITASGVAISSFMDIANDPEGFEGQVDEFINRLDEADDYYELDDDLDYYDKNGNSYDDGGGIQKVEEKDPMEKAFPDVALDKMTPVDVIATSNDNYTVDAVSNADGQGYIITATAHNGYNGDLQIALGIGNDGVVKGFATVVCNETAGLGSQCEGDEFAAQFVGLTAQEVKSVPSGAKVENNEIDAIAAATITTNAVTTAVNGAIDYYNANLR